MNATNTPPVKLHIDPKPMEHRFLAKKPTSTQHPVSLSVAEMEFYLKNHNGQNLRKKIGSGVVDKYSREMEAGTWSDSSTIDFDRTGNLINGQHRLKAAVKARKALKAFVKYGLKPEDAQNMDNHSKRTNACVLGLDGKPNGSLMAVIAANWAAKQTNTHSKSVSPAKMAEVFEANGEVIEWVATEAKKARKPPLRRAGFVTAIAMQMKEDPDNTRAFFSRVLIGADLKENSAELKIRERLLTCRGGGGSAVEKDFNYTNQAIEHFKKGEPMKDFKLTPYPAGEAKVVQMPQKAACAPSRVKRKAA